MELVAGQCTICQTNDKILTSSECECYIDYARKAFFENHSSDLQEFDSKKKYISLCSFCAFKMELSNTFKEQYEKTVSRQLIVKKSLSECFICDTKDWKLIKTDSDPAEFCSRITVFMNSVLTPRAFKQCAVCLYCLYHFHIWYDIRTTIFQKLGDGSLSSKPWRFVRNTNNNKETVKHSNSPKDVRNRKSLSPEKPVTSNTRKRKRPAAKDKNLTKTASNFKKFLNNSLSGLQPLIKQKNTKYSVHEEDKKMFEEIPYILINKNSQVSETILSLIENEHIKNSSTPLRSKRNSKGNEEIPAAAGNKKSPTNNYKKFSNGEISNQRHDSSTPTKNVRSSPRKHITPPKRDLNTSNSKTPQKTTKLPFKKTNKSKKRTVTSKRLNSTTSKPYFKIKSPTNFVKATKRKTLTPRKMHECSVCTDKFKKLHEYKAHILTHEKTGSFIINLPRINLSEAAASPEVTASTSVDNTDNIKDILTKYVGKSAADVFDEPDTTLDVQTSIDTALTILNVEETNNAEKSTDKTVEITESQKSKKEQMEIETKDEEIVSEKNSTHDSGSTQSLGNKIGSGDTVESSTVHSVNGSGICNASDVTIEKQTEKHSVDSTEVELSSTAIEKNTEENLLKVDSAFANDSTDGIVEYGSRTILENNEILTNNLKLLNELSASKVTYEENGKSDIDFCENNLSEKNANAEQDLSGNGSLLLDKDVTLAGSVSNISENEEGSSDVLAVKNTSEEGDVLSAMHTQSSIDVPDLLPEKLLAALFEKSEDNVESVSGIDDNIGDDVQFSEQRKRKRCELEDSVEDTTQVTPTKKKVRFACEDSFIEKLSQDNSLEDYQLIEPE